MMTTVHEDVRWQCGLLAQSMVRLEMAVRKALECAQWVQAGELQAERDQVQERRSRLMREVWAPCRRPRRERDT